MTYPTFYNSIPDATLLGTALLAFLADSFFPIVEVIPAPFGLLGWPLVVGGVVLAVRSLVALKERGTSTNPIDMPGTFITSGLFGRSRNPLYLGYIMAVLGVAIVYGSLGAFIAPVVCFTVLQVLIVPIEERNLQAKYGETYTAYKRTVRRWI